MELKEQKVIEIHKDLDKIVSKLEMQSKRKTKIHEVELDIFKGLLQLGLKLLLYYVYLVSDLCKLKGVPIDSLGNKMKNTGNKTRVYVSIFGRLGISRSKYYSKADKTYYVLDAYLGLPANNYSYVLSDWLTYNSVEMDFAQSAQHLGRILGQDFHSMQTKRLSDDLSKEVASYYDEKDWQKESDQTKTHLSVGFDGKGVPLIRSETGRAKESVSTRLGKGKKRGVKKEATVSVSSSFTAKQRSMEDIVNSLFSSQKQEQSTQNKQKHQWHEEKHIRAFLSDKAKAIEYGIDQVLERDGTGQKPIVVLIDGDRALEKAVKKAVVDRGIKHRIAAYVLDFIHLLEYVWKVANAHLGEKHPQREQWVKQQAKLLLTSQTKKVLQEWKEVQQQKNLTVTQSKNVKAAITYLTNHQHMVKYKTYLKRGYPITTGAVESACGHFVKSRMERNAMHWTRDGAQNMLNIRAIKKNGDWDEYLKQYVNKEQTILYQSAA